MRIIFMGTPDFACVTLRALFGQDKHQIVAVYTQAPKQAGRGRHISKTPVHLLAEKRHIPVLFPSSLKDEAVYKEFKAFKPDLVVVAAYGLLLPPKILETCLCINVHASLLPRWRGAAPIQRAILAGDKQTGITIMKMAEGLDSGDMIMKAAITITKEMNAGYLHDTLASLGGKLCLKAINAIEERSVSYTPQLEEGVTYAKKISKEEAKIDWFQGVGHVERQIRAFSPYPGAYLLYKQEPIKILKAGYERRTLHDIPGTVVDKQFSIACLNGVIQPEIVQRPGRKPMAIEEFLRGYRL
jgi:methionyl-tRNA formyltransferase